MKQMKSEFGKAYLDLNQKLDELIKEIITEAGQDVEGMKGTEDCIESLECRSRDGFIPFSHNCGGYSYRNFSDVMMIIGSGMYPASKEARKQIDKAYDTNQKYAREAMAAELKGIPKRKQNYHNLNELGKDDLAERLDEKVNELCGEDTIMYELRIMYHGVDSNGVHSASVSAAVNWESPYHRSHISWMPGFKCEHAKEIEVEFRTLKQAKERLTKAINEVKVEIL